MNRGRESLFYRFYQITQDGFYSKEALSAIMRLIVLSNGNYAEEAEAMLETALAIESEGVTDPASCKNTLLIASLVGEREEKIDALRALNRFFASDGYKTYPNEGAWCQSFVRRPDYLKRGFYEYAAGRLHNAVRFLESERKSVGESYFLTQLLALICMEAEEYEKALEYALRALWIDAETRIAHPVMEGIEERASRHLGEERSGRVRDRIVSFSEPKKIGFV